MWILTRIQQFAVIYTLYFGDKQDNFAKVGVCQYHVFWLAMALALP